MTAEDNTNDVEEGAGGPGAPTPLSALEVCVPVEVKAGIDPNDREFRA